MTNRKKTRQRTRFNENSSNLTFRLGDTQRPQYEPHRALRSKRGVRTATAERRHARSCVPEVRGQRHSRTELNTPGECRRAYKNIHENSQQTFYSNQSRGYQGSCCSVDHSKPPTHFESKLFGGILGTAFQNMAKTVEERETTLRLSTRGTGMGNQRGL